MWFSNDAPLFSPVLCVLWQSNLVADLVGPFLPTVNWEHRLDSQQNFEKWALHFSISHWRATYDTVRLSWYRCTCVVFSPGTPSNATPVCLVRGPMVSSAVPCLPAKISESDSHWLPCVSNGRPPHPSTRNELGGCFVGRSFPQSALLGV